MASQTSKYGGKSSESGGESEETVFETGARLSETVDRTPVDSPEVQNAQLRQFLKWFIPLALVFSLLEAVAYLFFQERSIGALSIILFSLGSLMFIAWSQIKRGRQRTAVALICTFFLIAALVIVPVRPELLSTLTMAPLVTVAIALPYTSGRGLKLLAFAAWVTATIVAFLGETVPYASAGPGWYESSFRVATLSMAVAVVLLLLWQFKTRLAGTLAQARAAEKRLQHEATHDPLTDLPNRTMFVDTLEKAMNQNDGREKSRDFALLFLDLDRFKNVNDSLGHGIGDLLLVEIARRLEGAMRAKDTVARLGGDEFVILLQETADEEDASAVAERIQHELQTPFKLYGHELFTTASIGVVARPVDYEKPEEILRDADTAMYRAKERGKARHVVFDRTMRTRAVSLLRLETDLRRAVEFDEFIVYYQPIVSLASGRVTGFEALVRWQHPERGMVAPGVFIPLAEETGLIGEIGLRVLDEACRKTALWRESFPAQRPLSVSVNLSAAQLTRSDFAENVARTLAGSGLDARDLILEITESAIMQDEEVAADSLSRLKELGVRFHVDDFGTGYSSLSRLHHYPVDALKVDRSFVGRLRREASEENAEIVETIIALARQLGMDVVAEGIENQSQLDRLRELGCDYGQGYYFSRPASAEASESILALDQVWR